MILTMLGGRPGDSGGKGPTEDSGGNLFGISGCFSLMRAKIFTKNGFQHRSKITLRPSILGSENPGFKNQ